MRRLNDAYMPTREAAKVLGIHPFAIQKLITKGRFPAEKIANRWLIPRESLEEFAKTYEGRRGRPRIKRKYNRNRPKGRCA